MVRRGVGNRVRKRVQKAVFFSSEFGEYEITDSDLHFFRSEFGSYENHKSDFQSQAFESHNFWTPAHKSRLPHIDLINWNNKTFATWRYSVLIKYYPKAILRRISKEVNRICSFIRQSRFKAYWHKWSSPALFYKHGKPIHNVTRVSDRAFVFVWCVVALTTKAFRIQAQTFSGNHIAKESTHRDSLSRNRGSMLGHWNTMTQ